MAGGGRRTWWTATAGRRTPREPWSVVVRGLGAGAAAGGLLGGSIQASDAVYRSWGSVALAGIVGALIALLPALAAVIVYQAVERRRARGAWLAGSVAAAVCVAGLAAATGVLATPAAALLVLATFAIALVLAPSITTRRDRDQPAA